MPSLRCRRRSRLTLSASLYLQNMQHLPVETIAGNIPKKLKALVIEAAPSGWTEALRKLVPSAHSVRVAL